MSTANTMIDGIGASEALDSAGERISISGMDISSLEKSGCWNYEHKNDQANQVLGRILVAKKIFKEEDCETERQLYFWNKIKIPYLYVMGDLFDSVGHKGAMDIAAMMRYDAQSRAEGRSIDNTINMSVEGSKLECKGPDILRSIARKVTLTVAAANKTAIAEILPDQKEIKPKKKSSELDFLKSEGTCIEVLSKSDYAGGAKKNPAGLWVMNHEPAERAMPAPKPIATQKPVANVAAPTAIPNKADTPNIPKANGSVLGQTKSGKDVLSHNKANQYSNFTSKDHSDAMNHHYNTAMNTSDYKDKNHHLGVAKQHSMMRDRAETFEGRSGPVKKSDTAPSNKMGNDALMKEKIDGIYKTFAKKSELETVIKNKNPKMNKAEVVALAKMIVYKKEVELEETLAKILE